MLQKSPEACCKGAFGQCCYFAELISGVLSEPSTDLLLLWSARFTKPTLKFGVRFIRIVKRMMIRHLESGQSSKKCPRHRGNSSKIFPSRKNPLQNPKIPQGTVYAILRFPKKMESFSAQITSHSPTSSSKPKFNKT